MADSVYPEKGDRLLVDPGRQMFQDTFGGQKHVQTGYTFVSSSGLDVTIAAGTAFAAGTRIDRDVTTVVAATNSATNYIFVYYKDDLDDNVVYFEINTTGTPPSGYTATSQKIMEVVASGGVITNDTDTRTLSPFAGPLRLGPLTGTFDLLSGDVAGRSRIGLSTSEDRVLFDGKTGGSTAAAVDVFRNTNTSGVRQFRVFQGDGTATVVGQIDQAGRLTLPITGVNAGLLIGGDANIYRSAADILHTDDIFESAAFFHGRSGGGAGAALRVGNDAEIHDINVSDALQIRGVATPANAVLSFGSGDDVRLLRGAANRLDLATGDSFRIVSGQLQFGADVALSRGIANRLDLASGDDFNIVGGNFLMGGTIVLNSLIRYSLDLVPSATNLRDLGSSSLKWRNLYMDQDIIMDAGQTVDGVDVSELANKNLWIPIQEELSVNAPVPLVDDNYPALELSSGVSQGCDGSFKMPRDWKVGISVSFVIYYKTDVAGSGNVRWEIVYRPRSEGETTTAGAITVAATDTPSTAASRMERFVITSPAGSGFASGDLIGFRIRRLGGDGADTYNQIVHLLGLEFEYTAG